MRRSCIAGFIALGLAVAERAPAQQGTLEAGPSRAIAPYRIAGTVADRGGNPVLGAEIAMVSGDSVMRRVRSDSGGKFEIDSVTVARVSLRVRRFGYEPQRLDVEVTKPGRTAKVFVTLDQSSVHLDTVIVQDDTLVVPPNPRLVAFKERAATNSFGHYVSEEMIAKVRPQFASDALRTVSGVVITPALRGRIGNTVRLRGCGTRGLSPERLGPLIWVDGVRLVGAEIDEVTAGPDIAAMEIYNSLVGVPAQYLDRTAVCGTILVWTKHR